MRRLLIVPLVLVFACAPSRPDAHPGALSEPGRGCEYVTYSDELPAPAELVAVDAFRSAVDELRDRRGLDPARLVFTLRYDADGTNIVRDVIEHDAPPAVADSVQAILFRTLEPVGEREREWSVRLEAEVAEAVELRVGPSQYCPPRPRSVELERALRQPVSRAPRTRQGRRSRTVIVRATVGVRGAVVGVEPRSGAWQGTEDHRRVLQHLQQFTFEPAHVDSVPVPGTIDLPLRMWR